MSKKKSVLQLSTLLSSLSIQNRPFKTSGSEVMAPIPMSNGVHTGMPLTEYSARPTCEKTAASSLVPEAFLLPDGHPDVSNSFRRSLNFVN